MSSHKPSPAGRVVARARNRAGAYAVESALRTIFGLVFLSALAGFGWGMWQEVERDPGKYASARTTTDIYRVADLSARAAVLLANLQGERPHTTHKFHAEETDDDDNTINSPAASVPNLREPAPADPVLEPTDPFGLAGPDPTDIEEPLPEPTLDAPPPVPPPAKPARLPAGPKLSRSTNDLLRRANAIYDKGYEYHEMSAPEAPHATRDKARKAAIKYFDEALKLYRAALDRDLPDDVRKGIQFRITQIQRFLFWARKFSAPTRR